MDVYNIGGLNNKSGICFVRFKILGGLFFFGNWDFNGSLCFQSLYATPNTLTRVQKFREMYLVGGSIMHFNLLLQLW